MTWRCIVIEEDPTQSVELCEDMLRTIFIQCSSWSHRICFAMISQSSFCTSYVHVNPNVVNDWVGSALSSHGIYRPHMLSTALHCFLEFVCVWLSFFVVDCQCPFQMIIICGSRKLNHAASGQLTEERIVVYRDQCSTETIALQRPMFRDQCSTQTSALQRPLQYAKLSSVSQI